MFSNIFFDLNKRNVIENFGKHIHVQNSIEKIETWENCKRKAEECISTKPIKIIRTELLKSSLTTALNHQNVRHILV